MADMSGAAVAESPLERVQRQIFAVEDELEELRAKKKAEKDEDKLKEINDLINMNKVYHGKLLDEKRALEAKIGGVAAPPGACRLPPRPLLLCHTAAHRAEHLATTRASI